MQIRRGAERGTSNLGWLDSRHSFSFGEYHDPDQMGFGVLRVINEDRVAPATGFGTHGHRDMEIVSYVLSGTLEHRDSLGNGSLIVPGDVQRMTAGAGVLHSERNPSDREPVHFLQIWVRPERAGLAPGYAQRHFDDAEKRGTLRLVLSPDGASDSLRWHQDARLYAGLLDGAERADLSIGRGRLAYVHVARGGVEANGVPLEAGDALKLTDPGHVALAQGVGAEVLVFDLPQQTHRS